MKIDPIIAATRFGTGLRPGVQAPTSVEAMLRLVDQDGMQREFPMTHQARAGGDLQRQVALTKAHRANVKSGDKTSDQAKETRAALQAMNRQLRRERFEMLRHTVARGVHSPHGLTERLTWFWADHFTAQGKSAMHEVMYGDYLDNAIRANILGPFEDMLWAVISHPLMLHYLDQSRSVGPNSALGQRNKRRGVNENLAREVLELHTLGVGGPYGQTDVQALAGALTGMTEKLGDGFRWNSKQAEPGPFEILGRSYARPQRRDHDLRVVVRDLARHPATAQHLATKLARHFVADDPPAALVAALNDVYLQTNGDLRSVTEALLRHPASWQAKAQNVKWPIEYITSGLRALGLPPTVMKKMQQKRTKELLEKPLVQMGQRWQGAGGPDGIAEADDRWITPQGLAARLEWALTAPDQLLVRYPDPREVLIDALGDRAPQSLRFAVESASLRQEAVALIFASPAFQRR